MGQFEIVKKFSDNKLAVIGNSFVEARYDMSVNQQKLFIALVSLIKKNDTEFKEVEITADALMKIFNIAEKKDIYNVIDVVSQRLMERIVNIQDHKRKFFERYSIFQKMTYRNGLLTVRFNEDMKPFLLMLQKEFTKFKLSEIKPFESKYSIRIYQLLKQYQNLKKRNFEIDNLRKILGIGSKQYKNFRDFRKKVIEIAQKELENTPMAFEWEPIKRGRGGKVVEVIFKLKQIQKQNEIPLSENTKKQLKHKADKRVQINKRAKNEMDMLET